jgi:antitoxin component YwqK of YwqJK toxin-antitoxin module
MHKILSAFTCFFVFSLITFANTAQTSEDSILLIDYYSNGKRKLESYYHVKTDAQGKMVYAATGKQTKYYKTGIVEGVQYFKDGVPHGKCEAYTEAGVLHKVFYYTDGKLNGPYTFYYPDGQVERTGTFRNDVDYGPSKRYHANGKLYMEESYNEQGVQEGEVKIYDEQGILIKQEMMYNGKKKN